MRKLLLPLLLLPFFGYGQQITITQSQQIDLKLPEAKTPGVTSGNARAQLIAGAAICAAGVGIGLAGPDVSEPARGQVYRRVGAGVFAVGAGFTISGIVKLK